MKDVKYILYQKTFDITLVSIIFSSRVACSVVLCVFEWMCKPTHLCLYWNLILLELRWGPEVNPITSHTHTHTHIHTLTVGLAFDLMIAYLCAQLAKRPRPARHLTPSKNTPPLTHIHILHLTLTYTLFLDRSFLNMVSGPRPGVEGQ